MNYNSFFPRSASFLRTIAACAFTAPFLNRNSPAGAFIALLLLITIPLRSQEFNSLPTVVVEDLIEKIAQESEEELDYHTLFADIYRYL